MPKVTLISHTPEPEKVVAAAAKLCYSRVSLETLLDGLTQKKAADYLGMLSEMGHESPLEHASFTFGIEGVSRAFLAQITRHRLASYSVQSQRYVPKDAFESIMPPEIQAVPEAARIFQEAMENARSSYEQIAAILKEKYLEASDKSPAAIKAAEKKAIEDARFVLPNACDTRMVVTMNVRSLYHFFALRCCNRAQWEIRAVADQMLRLVSQAAPALFAKAGPSCCLGQCREGRMSCGKAQETRQRIAALKSGL